MKVKCQSKLNDDGTVSNGRPQTILHEIYIISQFVITVVVNGLKIVRSCGRLNSIATMFCLFSPVLWGGSFLHTWTPLQTRLYILFTVYRNRWLRCKSTLEPE